jgi:2-polyprenyl-3-methyl-5-hydroxy-6-metoxy-1,4-benzoquinol methylase
MQVAELKAYREHPIEWTDEKVARVWDYFSRTTDIYFSKVYGNQILRWSGLPLGQNLQVLDFGCGPGYMWEHIEAQTSSWQYTGLDFSPESVTALEQKANGKPQYAGAHHVTELPSSLPANHFDVVLVVEVVEHLSDEHLESTLAEAARTLKPGGALVITTPNEENLDANTHLCPDCGAIFHAWQHVRQWSIDSLNHRVQQHGFKMHVAHALDFSAMKPLKRMFRIGRRLLQGKVFNPHMIMVFRKQD